MGISVSIILLVYLVIVALGYMASIYSSTNNQTGVLIINKSYMNAFLVLFFAVALAIMVLALPFIPVDQSFAARLFLGSKFISITTLFISLYVLSRKYLKPPISK